MIQHESHVMASVQRSETAAFKFVFVTIFKPVPLRQVYHQRIVVSSREPDKKKDEDRRD